MSVLVGCKLPHGIRMFGTMGQPIIINGMNTSLIAGGYGITTLEDHEWEFLKAEYDDFDPMIKGAIFSHGTDKVGDIIDLAADLRNVTTGFEGLDPNNPGAKIGDDANKLELKPNDNGEKLSKQLEVNEKAAATGALPRKKTSKADQAAALAVAQAEVTR